MSWQITAPRLTKEERKAIAQADEVARRRTKNKAAKKKRRRQSEEVGMSLHHTPTTDYDEDVWTDLNVCLDTLDYIGEKLPLYELIAYARDNDDFDQDIRERLQKLSAAVCTLMDDGENAIWDFATAAGMIDGLVARLQQQRDAERMREADPNSPINRK